MQVIDSQLTGDKILTPTSTQHATKRTNDYFTYYRNNTEAGESEGYVYLLQEDHF